MSAVKPMHFWQFIQWLFLLPELLATWRNILFFLLCVFSSLGCGALGCDNVACSCTHVDAP